MKTIDLAIKTAKGVSLWCIEGSGIAVRYPNLDVPEEEKEKLGSGFYYYSVAYIPILGTSVRCLEGPIDPHKLPREVRQLFEIEMWAAALPAPPSEAAHLFVDLRELEKLNEAEKKKEMLN